MALEAEKADFIEAQKSLADLGASQAVNKSSCAPVASVHEASEQKQCRRLAREDHSAVLVQLPSRISEILKSGAGTGEVPFCAVPPALLMCSMICGTRRLVRCWAVCFRS